MQVILQLETLSRAGDRHLPCNNTYHNYSSSAAVAADRNCWHLALFMSYYFVVFAAFRRSNHGDARPRGGEGKCIGASERGLPSGIFRCALNGNETFAVAQNANARTLPTTHIHRTFGAHTHTRGMCKCYLYIAYMCICICGNTIHNALCRGTANIIAYFMQRCTEQTSQLAFANFQFSARCFFLSHSRKIQIPPASLPAGPLPFPLIEQFETTSHYLFK